MFSIALFFLICAISMPKLISYSDIEILGKSDDGMQYSIELTNKENCEYFASVNLGTPAQKFNLSIDTSGYRIVVPDKNCVSCKNFTNFFDPKSSDTYQGPYASIRLNFSDDQYVSGNLSSETASFGPEKLAEAKGQYFLLIEHDNDVKFDEDGLFGLGFNLEDGTSTYIQTLVDQRVIKKSIFSLFLNNINRKNQPKSALVIGGSDDKYAKGSYTYLELADFRGYWEINITEISTPAGTLSINSETAIIDSKSEIIWGPNNYIDNVLSYFKEKFGCSGSKYLYIHCPYNRETKYPDIVFTLEGNKYSVCPESYFQIFNNGTAMLLLYSHNLTGWILGVPFLREYYSVYDMENLQIYLAPAVTGDDDSGVGERIWVITIVVIIAILSIVSIGVVSYCFYKKRRNSRNIAYKSIAMEYAMTSSIACY
ncbi:CYM_6 [Blepharisma stoltei]|uniref:Peptidase A1 domain-containing protein n=1 Tax=Blepharisma stoltei TaxID=1481888 RepID=A0AAU9J016_9CILI|nr:unnamed protein product [Blepharisma stoltei]